MTKNKKVKTFQDGDDDHTACPRNSARKKKIVKMNGRWNAKSLFILRKVSLYQSLNVNSINLQLSSVCLIY